MSIEGLLDYLNKLSGGLVISLLTWLDTLKGLIICCLPEAEVSTHPQ